MSGLFLFVCVGVLPRAMCAPFCGAPLFCPAAAACFNDDAEGTCYLMLDASSVFIKKKKSKQLDSSFIK